MSDTENMSVLQSVHAKYLDPGFPASFMEMSTFYKHLDKNTKKQVSLSRVKRYLMSDQNISVMNALPRKHKYMKIVVPRMFYMFEIDVALFDRKLAKYNAGYVGFLLVIDSFSKYVWCRGLKKVNGESVTKAFTSILKQATDKCDNIRSDRGSEFISSTFQNLLKKYNINHIFAPSPQKAAVAERAISTIKKKLSKFMAIKNSQTWFRALASVTDSYNNTVHSSTNMEPASVNASNQYYVWREMYEKDFVHYPKVSEKDEREIYAKDDYTIPDKDRSQNIFQYKFNVGDVVRLSIQKYQFRRIYHQSWTSEYFYITERLMSQNFKMYTVKDGTNTMVEGKFYETELLKVSVPKDTLFRIEKVIVTEKDRLYVKWEGFAKKYNSWVNKNDVYDISSHT